MFSDSFDLSIIPETPISHQNVVPETPYHTYPENMVPESPLHTKFVPETPLPPPIPSFSPVNFVPTVPITPARLQGQRWRNWANTRLGHLPQNLVYTEEEIMQRFEEADNEVVLDNRDNPRVQE
jgi:hypothetical protein